MTALRLVTTVLITWVVLIVLLVAPSALLPQRWHYYIYSPASVGLWLLTALVAPFVVCVAYWPWIRPSSRRPRSDGARNRTPQARSTGRDTGSDTGSEPYPPGGADGAAST
ncbi:hypothetical protein ACFVW2_30890 [Streptomyces sp. NPDC058171]